MARTSKYQTSAESVKKDEWRAGLYIRLSREDGDKSESESVSSQKAILERFVLENGFSYSEFYIDDGWSGTDFERPAFKRMMTDVAGGKVNCVIVKDLSRFGRNYVEAGKYLENVFPIFKTRFIAVNDGIDSAQNPSSMNSVIVPFKNIINDEYCRDISMKVRAALDVRRKQGKFIGSFAAYGYKKDDKNRNKLIIDEEAAQTVRQIFSEFLAGNSIMGIARGLNDAKTPNPSVYKAKSGLNCRRGNGLWLDSTVRRILKNEVYIGNLVQKKNEIVSYKIHVAKAVDKKDYIRVENTHEGIISKADFEKAQALLNRDTRISPKTRELSVFAGFIKCADCGRAMQKRTVKQPYKTYDYYCCSTYRKSHSSCTKHAIRADILEDVVLTFINKYISLAVDFNALVEKINKVKRGGGKSQRLCTLLETKERELEKTQRILLDLYPDFKNGLITRERYFALKEKYEAEEKEQKQAIARVKSEMQDFNRGVDGSNEFISTFLKFNGLKKLTREVMCGLVENIFIHADGTVEIRLKCKDAFLAAEEYVRKNAKKSSENFVVLN